MYCESVVNDGSQTVVGGLEVVGVGCLVGVVFVFVVFNSISLHKCIYTDD